MSSERDDPTIETSATPTGGPQTDSSAVPEGPRTSSAGMQPRGGASPALGAITRRGVLKAGTAAGLAVAGAGGYLFGSHRGLSTVAGARAMAPARQNGNVLVAGWEEDAQTLDPAKTICGHEVRIVNQFGNTL